MFDSQLSFSCVQDGFTSVSNPKVNETPLPPADPARLMLFLGSLKSKSANGPRCTVRDAQSSKFLKDLRRSFGLVRLSQWAKQAPSSGATTNLAELPVRCWFPL